MTFTPRLLVLVLASLALACGGETPLSAQPCPSVVHSKGNTYGVQSTLLLNGKEASGTLPAHETGAYVLYAGHPLAVPAAGDVELDIRVTVTDKLAVAYLYGPRGNDGIFGGCAKEIPAVRGQTEINFTYVVPPGDGGEYLLLVGANPIGDAANAPYTAAVTCRGDNCDAPSCPALVGVCQDEVCVNGFVKDETELGCPTCQCNAAHCGPGLKLVADRCVCDCPLATASQAVCGDDSKTYPSECFAHCHGVSVGQAGTCEAVCEDLSGCTLDCPNGFKKAKGCATCQCAAACDNASPIYAPVCGTDGLTYTNRDRLVCSTLGAADPVGVLSLGSCRPTCRAPAECALSCPFGYRPKVGLGQACYACECMPSPSSEEGACFEPGMWCSRPQKGPYAAFGASPVSPALTQADIPTPDPGKPAQPILPHAAFMAEVLKHRTFINRCVAESADWAPVLGAPCPTGVCNDQLDCAPAKNSLDKTLAIVKQTLDLPAAATFDPPVGCALPNKGTVPLCQFKLPTDCTPDDPNACNAVSQCVVKPGTDKARCVYSCPCLNQTAGRVYDPVCANVGGEQTTLYNPCMALCLKATIEYPGQCCPDGRKSLEERFELLGKVSTFCEARGRRARAFMASACPPTLEMCEEEEDRCCRDTLASATPTPAGG